MKHLIYHETMAISVMEISTYRQEYGLPKSHNAVVVLVAAMKATQGGNAHARSCEGPSVPVQASLLQKDEL